MRTINVKARCPHCGNIETTISECGVVIDMAARRSSFRVRCPECGEVVTDNLDGDPELLRRLVAGGVMVSYLG
jgi:predicted RNA-binding Zn-ribbon protein involved in translation (DUF1610 family)